MIQQSAPRPRGRRMKNQMCSQKHATLSHVSSILSAIIPTKHSSPFRIVTAPSSLPTRTRVPNQASCIQISLASRYRYAVKPFRVLTKQIHSISTRFFKRVKHSFCTVIQRSNQTTLTGLSLSCSESLIQSCLLLVKRLPTSKRSDWIRASEPEMKKSRATKAVKAEANNTNAWWWLTNSGISASFICVSLFAILVRVAVSLHPYSGAGDPPKYGDFEAQRHWMEITTNLPANEWYQNTTKNDLSYWGLDYPPLTAYQSYVHGLVLKFFHPESVLLNSSRGHESYFGKLLMRWTVLTSDILIFFPAVLWLIVAFADQSNGHKSNIAWHVAMILLNPCLILIDHGHFQYNCISLGITVGAVAAVLCDKDLVASVLFSLALNHKQMSAYYAPAFFSYLLGKCLKRQNPILEVSKLGMIVIITFALVWWPYLHSRVAVLEVLSRLAPFERGLYEDYVANFWCTTSVLIKWKRLFTTQSLKLLCLLMTVCSCLPSMILQIRAPSSRAFLYGLLNSALSFYLFSFQVHEKSILLPLLPASILAIEEPFMFQWFMQFALLSMFPLLCRDKLLLPYMALYGLFIFIYYAPNGKPDTLKTRFWPRVTLFFVVFLLFSSFVLHIVYLTIDPPKKYPFFFEAIIMLLCFSQFVLVAIYTNRKQWILSMQSSVGHEKKRA